MWWARNPFSQAGYNFVRNRGDMAYGVSRDGQRFLMTRPKSITSERLVLVLNWFTELRGRR